MSACTPAYNNMYPKVAKTNLNSISVGISPTERFLNPDEEEPGLQLMDYPVLTVLCSTRLVAAGRIAPSVILLFYICIYFLVYFLHFLLGLWTMS